MKPGRLPQLDGLRAIAVGCVMAFHYVPGINSIAPLGSIGVRLFFVLSGFLITGILLDWRGHALAPALKSFYIRRSLRILPLFYLVLAIAWMMNIGPVRSTIGWHVSYLTNIYFFIRGGFDGAVSHLWSLAVEEQFYLVWPWLVLLLPRPRLPHVIVAMICLAPISRVLIGGPMNAALPTSCLDSLGAGALLAVPEARASMMRVGAGLGAPLLLAAMLLRLAGFTTLPFEVALDFGVSLTAAWCVGRAAEGFGPGIAAALTLRPVVYVGTISYGLYLFHGFMPFVLGRYVTGFIDMNWLTRATLLTTTTLVVASLSWRLFEAPILKLKERFSRSTDFTDYADAA